MVCEGVLVDANIIKDYIKEEMSSEGEISKLINDLLTFCGLGVSDVIESEWKSTTGNQFFKIWFEDQLKINRIRFVDKKIKLNSAEKKRIHNYYGLPREKSNDIEYIKCSLNTLQKYILTYDIHFFDPKKKMSSAKTKKKIKEERTGVFCRYLSKKHGITIGLPKHCRDDMRIT